MPSLKAPPKRHHVVRNGDKQGDHRALAVYHQFSPMIRRKITINYKIDLITTLVNEEKKLKHFSHLHPSAILPKSKSKQKESINNMIVSIVIIYHVFNEFWVSLWRALRPVSYF